MLIWRRSPLPHNLTSYDVLKTIAILLMVIDHLGYFFFPEEPWFRILGRLCVPIWFFLIGYARTRDISGMALLGAAILLGSALLAGGTFFPLSILITLMIGRFYIDIWVKAGIRGGEAFAGLFCMLLIFGFPTAALFEYGTIGLLFTVFGALCRYKQDASDQLPPQFMRELKIFTAAAFAVFIIWQAAPMPYLSGMQLSVLVVGMIAIALWLWHFRPVEYAGLTAKLPKPLVSIFHLTGRRTLEIYVLHIVLLRAAVMYLYPERFPVLEWEWFPAHIIELFNIFILDK